MAALHLLVCSGRFSSVEEMRRFLDPTYTEDGDMVASEFMREVQLEGFAPACIEAVWEPQPRPLAELLRGISWAEQWLPQVEHAVSASAAICVFEPNALRNPAGTSLQYCGSYRYDPGVVPSPRTTI